MSATANTYINGSNLIVSVGGVALGMCTSHTVTYNSETKDRAVKPGSDVTSETVGLWKEKGVNSLSVSISGEGLRGNNDGIAALLTAWKAGTAVAVLGYTRGNGSSAPYLSGSFIITSIEESAPAEDDATYSISLENNGEVTITEAKTHTTAV